MGWGRLSVGCRGSLSPNVCLVSPAQSEEANNRRMDLGTDVHFSRTKFRTHLTEVSLVYVSTFSVNFRGRWAALRPRHELPRPEPRSCELKKKR